MTRTTTRTLALALLTITAWAVARPGAASAQQPKAHHKTIKVGDLDIFYREAGPKDAPAILLLHGFPTSSQMFRNLIPALADRYRVIAPDYPGFGHSSMPSRDKFTYTFDNLAKVIDEYCVELEKQDMTECPPEFRLAFNRHIESWRTTAVTIRQIPGMMDAFLAGMLSAVTGDDATSGGAGDLKKAEQEIRKTYEEVERIAAKYEVAL